MPRHFVLPLQLSTSKRRLRSIHTTHISLIMTSPFLVSVIGCPQSNKLLLNLPGSSDGKESVCNAGDLCLIPGSGRSGEGKGYLLHAMTGEPRGFSRVTAGFSSYDGAFSLPLVLAQASPIFHSSCEGKLGIALE